MQLDFSARELTVKLVYYGPALSGKTTNLQAVHELLDTKTVGRLMTLETRDDRTLFFDLLPISFKSEGGLSVRIKLFTVPGQVMHNATRRLVLQGADGIAFIADSRISETNANKEAFLNLRYNLSANGLNCDDMPLVIQFNKRDLPETRSNADIERMQKLGREPVFMAVAVQGVGVIETLKGLIDATFQQLDAKHGLGEKFGLDVATLSQEMLPSVEAGAAPADEMLEGAGQ